jgi:hypothetical protein
LVVTNYTDGSTRRAKDINWDLEFSKNFPEWGVLQSKGNGIVVINPDKPDFWGRYILDLDWAFGFIYGYGR